MLKTWISFLGFSISMISGALFNFCLMFRSTDKCILILSMFVQSIYLLWLAYTNVYYKQHVHNYYSLKNKLFYSIFPEYYLKLLSFVRPITSFDDWTFYLFQENFLMFFLTNYNPDIVESFTSTELLPRRNISFQLEWNTLYCQSKRQHNAVYNLFNW